MECVVWANVELSDQPISGEHRLMVGSVDQVVEDIVETDRLGADELFIDLSQSEPFQGTSWVSDTALEIKERVTALASEVVRRRRRRFQPLVRTSARLKRTGRSSWS
jgi:hypothetical protein